MPADKWYEDVDFIYNHGIRGHIKCALNMAYAAGVKAGKIEAFEGAATNSSQVFKENSILTKHFRNKAAALRSESSQQNKKSYSKSIGQCATGKCGHDDSSWCEREINTESKEK